MLKITDYGPMTVQQNINLAEGAVVLATLSWISTGYASSGPYRDRLQGAIQRYNKMLGIERLPLVIS